jgi:hypothetical protein
VQPGQAPSIGRIADEAVHDGRQRSADQQRQQLENADAEHDHQRGREQPVTLAEQELH